MMQMDAGSCGWPRPKHMCMELVVHGAGLALAGQAALVALSVGGDVHSMAFLQRGAVPECPPSRRVGAVRFSLVEKWQSQISRVAAWQGWQRHAGTLTRRSPAKTGK